MCAERSWDDVMAGVLEDHADAWAELAALDTGHRHDIERDVRLPRRPLGRSWVRVRAHDIVQVVRDSAGVKAIHYANGDVDYRDANAFIDGLEELVETSSLQAEFDAWDALTDEAWAEVEL